jgi:hypothetical protein
LKWWGPRLYALSCLSPLSRARGGGIRYPAYIADASFYGSILQYPLQTFSSVFHPLCAGVEDSGRLWRTQCSSSKDIRLLSPAVRFTWCHSLSLVRLLWSRAGTWTVSFEGGSWHGFLARPEVRHDTKYFGPCWHDTNTRAVPCLESRHGGLHGPAHILDRAWAGTTRKWHVDTCTTIQYNVLTFIILLLM